MCYLAVLCSTLTTARLCLQTANRSSTTWTCWFKSTQSATPLSRFPSRYYSFFLLLHLACSMTAKLWPHANLSHSRCKCEAEYLCIAFTEELSCDIPLCQCVVETKHQLQDIGEQIEHKVSAFHLDSRPHATLGFQSGADVKSSAALLIYWANSVSTCACENYQSARQTKRGGGIIALENFLYLCHEFKSATVHLFHYWNGPIIMGLLRFSEWCLANHVISMW